MQKLLARLTPLKRIGATLGTSRSIMAKSDPYLSCAAPLHALNYDTSDLGAVVVFCGEQNQASVFDESAVADGMLLSITLPVPNLSQEEAEAEFNKNILWDR